MALATIPVYLGYVGDERFGVIAIIMAFLAYLSFMDIGLGRAVARRIAQFSEAPEKKRSDILWTSILTSIFLGALAGVILYTSGEYLLTAKIAMSDEIRSEALIAVKYMSFALPLLIPVPSMMGALNSRYFFKQANFVLFSSNILSQVIPLILAANGIIDVSVLVLCVLLVKISVSLILVKVCQPLIPLSSVPSFNFQELKQMINYGGWTSVVGFLSPLLTTIDRLFIASILGVKSVTYYVIPYDLVTKVMIISGSISTALFPRLVSASDQDAVDLSVAGTRTLMSVMTPVIVVSIILIGPFLELWVGANLAGKAKHIPEILLLGLWVNALVIPTYSRHLARANPRTIVFIFLFQLPVYATALIFGLKTIGILGVAFAWTFRVALDTLMILGLHSMIGVIIYNNALSLMIVCISVAIHFLGFNLFHSLVLGGVLVIVSIYMDKHVLLGMYRELSN